MQSYKECKTLTGSRAMQAALIMMSSFAKMLHLVTVFSCLSLLQLDLVVVVSTAVLMHWSVCFLQDTRHCVLFASCLRSIADAGWPIFWGNNSSFRFKEQSERVLDG